jgi:hypothetical protein
MRMRRTTALPILLFLAGNWLAAQTVAFNHVRIHRHRSPQGRMLSEREGVLTFDDVNKKVTFQNILSDRFDEQIKFEAPTTVSLKLSSIRQPTCGARGIWPC